MQLIPSIDLRGGQCVRLLKGEFDAETRYEVDPRALLRRYADAGATWLHVVDLDGARDGTPGNRQLIRELVDLERLSIQLGGGLRTRELIDEVPHAGIARAVIGCAAVDAPTLLRDCLERHGAEKICLAVDVRIDETGVPRVRTRGWVKEHALSLWELLESFDDTGLLHVLCTDIERDGAMVGPNFDLYTTAQARCPQFQWQTSGGIHSLADLAHLESLDLAAAISGKALLE